VALFTRLVIAVWLTHGLIVVLLTAPHDWDGFLVKVAPEMLKAAIVAGVVWFAGYLWRGLSAPGPKP
jgi:hypothetical protein